MFSFSADEVTLRRLRCRQSMVAVSLRHATLSLSILMPVAINMAWIKCFSYGWFADYHATPSIFFTYAAASLFIRHYVIIAMSLAAFTRGALSLRHFHYFIFDCHY